MQTAHSSPWIIRLSESIYRLLLRSIGSTSYFHPYGDLTIQLFRECCQDAYRKRGTFGVLGLWLPSFRDVVVQMVIEVLCAQQHTSQPHVSARMVFSALAFEYGHTPMSVMRKFIQHIRWPFLLKRALRRSWLAYPTNMHFDQQLLHWHFNSTTPQYESGVDTKIHQGISSAFLLSTVAETEAFAVLRQTLNAHGYRGKRLRFSGDIKVKQVEQQAGLWEEVVVQSLPHHRGMRLKPENVVQGTHEWMRYEQTIFIPEDAYFVRFGLVLYGTGQIWLANARLEVIEQDGMLST